jgi:hypothetical protein
MLPPAPGAFAGQQQGGALSLRLETSRARWEVGQALGAPSAELCCFARRRKCCHYFAKGRIQ